ncbi:nitroreductase/quinone reductase family protein [Microbacterium sp. B2969]|uniref:Nitroreductase/quinone reductase family protein n=1 Tax=Microbacterium alkaliflavum TaxID=3248839 RepID=A0ABW7QD16_9MICO
MDSAIAKALALGPDSTMADHTVDITTIGARSGEPRRIEIWFHNVDGAVYLTGLPGPRSWYANLIANPRFTFHLKHAVHADLAATAVPITAPDDRARLFGVIIRGIDDLYVRRGSRRHVAQPERWLAESPLVRVEFD